MTNTTESSQATGSAANIAGKFLTFFLAGEEYGLEILKVHEIIGFSPITHVPRTQSHIRGVINLRGKVIPIVDLRLKFGMESAEETDQTCIIVVQTESEEIGIVVDKVSEVLDVVQEDIQETPCFGSEVRTDFILGIGKTNGKVRILLDIEKALSDQDSSELRRISADQLKIAA